MSRKCQITGKRPLRARNVSHAHVVTNRWQKPNVHRKRIYVPELDRWVRLKVSTRALRSINKMGLEKYLRKHGLSLGDVT